MKAPGFVDLQVNGYAGVDFHDPSTTVADVLICAEALARAGTAGFLATITTSPRESMERCVDTLRQAIERQGAAGNILGIHLEGPFISPEYGFVGMHPPRAVSPPDASWLEKVRKLAGGHLKMVTLAPEYEQSAALIAAFSPEIIFAAGHSNAAYPQLQKAVRAGLRMATHVGNGCVQTVDRHNNPLVHILASAELILSFIPDGFHLPEAFIRMLVNSRPVEKLIAVSDAMTQAGLPPGEYENIDGTRVVLEENGWLHTAGDANVLAGSSYNLLQCMNHLAALSILDDEGLWRVGLLNPLKMLGLDVETFLKRGGGLRYDSATRRFVQGP